VSSELLNDLKKARLDLNALLADLQQSVPGICSTMLAVHLADQIQYATHPDDRATNQWMRKYLTDQNVQQPSGGSYYYGRTAQHASLRLELDVDECLNANRVDLVVIYTKHDNADLIDQVTSWTNTNQIAIKKCLNVLLNGLVSTHWYRTAKESLVRAERRAREIAKDIGHESSAKIRHRIAEKYLVPLVKGMDLSYAAVIMRNETHKTYYETIAEHYRTAEKDNQAADCATFGHPTHEDGRQDTRLATEIHDEDIRSVSTAKENRRQSAYHLPGQGLIGKLLQGNFERFVQQNGSADPYLVGLPNSRFDSEGEEIVVATMAVHSMADSFLLGSDALLVCVRQSRKYLSNLFFNHDESNHLISIAESLARSLHQVDRAVGYDAEMRFSQVLCDIWTSNKLIQSRVSDSLAEICERLPLTRMLFATVDGSSGTIDGLACVGFSEDLIAETKRDLNATERDVLAEAVKKKWYEPQRLKTKDGREYAKGIDVATATRQDLGDNVVVLAIPDDNDLPIAVILAEFSSLRDIDQSKVTDRLAHYVRQLSAKYRLAMHEDRVARNQAMRLIVDTLESEHAENMEPIKSLVYSMESLGNAIQAKGGFALLVNEDTEEFQDVAAWNACKRHDHPFFFSLPKAAEQREYQQDILASAYLHSRVFQGSLSDCFPKSMLSQIYCLPSRGEAVAIPIGSSKRIVGVFVFFGYEASQLRVGELDSDKIFASAVAFTRVAAIRQLRMYERENSSLEGVMQGMKRFYSDHIGDRKLRAFFDTNRQQFNAVLEFVATFFEATFAFLWSPDDVISFRSSEDAGFFELVANEPFILRSSFPKETLTGIKQRMASNMWGPSGVVGEEPKTLEQVVKELEARGSGQGGGRGDVEKSLEQIDLELAFRPFEHSLRSAVVRSLSVVTSEDSNSDRRTSGTFHELLDPGMVDGPYAWLGVPVLVKDAKITSLYGMVTLMRKRSNVGDRRGFTERDKGAAELLAGIIAMGLHHTNSSARYADAVSKQFRYFGHHVKDSMKAMAERLHKLQSFGSAGLGDTDEVSRILNEMTDCNAYSHAAIKSFFDFFSRDLSWAVEDTPYAVNSVISNVLSILGNRLEGIKVVSSHVDPTVVTDREQGKLMAVIHALITNAIKATLEKGEKVEKVIELKCFWEQSHVVVSVSDNGVGLCQDFKQSELVRFGVSQFKLESTGIGLAMVDDFVRALGGEFILQPDSAGGTEATVKFPISSRFKEN